MALHITRHALQRAVERVPGVTCEEEAREVLNSRAVLTAAAFAHGRECFVRLATGERIAIRDDSIVTVLPAENYRGHIRRIGKGRYG